MVGTTLGAAGTQFTVCYVAGPECAECLRRAPRVVTARLERGADGSGTGPDGQGCQRRHRARRPGLPTPSTCQRAVSAPRRTVSSVRRSEWVKRRHPERRHTAACPCPACWETAQPLAQRAMLVCAFSETFQETEDGGAAASRSSRGGIVSKESTVVTVDTEWMVAVGSTAQPRLCHCSTTGNPARRRTGSGGALAGAPVGQREVRRARRGAANFSVVKTCR